MEIVRKKMKGVSELIVIITILLVSVAAVFAFRAWLGTQQQRMGSIDMATASYSVQYSPPNTAIVSLLVRNNLPSQLGVVGFNITLSNGTVLFQGSPGVTASPSLASPVQVGAKSDALITITITSLSSGVTVGDINVLVVDPSTNLRQATGSPGLPVYPGYLG